MSCLTDYSWFRIVESLKVLETITKATSLDQLPGNQIIEKIEDSKVPDGFKTDAVRKERDSKKFEFFKNNFEHVNRTHGLSKVQIMEWMKANTGLGNKGTFEALAAKNHWNPTLITNSRAVYGIRDIDNLQSAKALNINVLEVDKNELDKVKNLLDNIASASLLPENYADFNADIDTLPDNTLLPIGYRRSDIINSYKDFRQWKVDNDFIQEFISAGGKAVAFANDFSNRSVVLDYLKTSTDFFGNVWEIDGADAGEVFNNEWLSTEIYISFGVIIANYKGEDWNALTTSKDEAEEEIWIRGFKSVISSTLSRAEILTYRKKVGFGYNPPLDARRVLENRWAGNQFSYLWILGSGWRANISTYTSHKQTDNNFDATKIDKQELDKVNKILYDINKALTLADLTTINIKGYDEGKVPDRKKYIDIKNLYDAKKGLLDRDTADQTARTNAIQAVKDYWNSLMNGQITDTLGNNWVKNFNSKQGTEITNYKNELKNLISQAKISPDISEIENELNKKPVVSSNELIKLEYRVEMLNLVANDIQRASRKSEIITEIKEIRKNKLEKVCSIITNAQTIKDKDATTKEELEKIIADLKILINAPADSAEQIIWTENKDTNQKLLTDLEDKLSKITPSEPEKEEPDKPQIPTPPPSPTSKEEAEKFGEDYANLEPTQKEGRKNIVENWKKEENYDRSKICRHCPQEFHYDRSLEYLPAKQKVEKELSEHENSCSFKEKVEEAKKVKQDNWESSKKAKTRYFYACRKCWGKIELDKGISDWEDAKNQARADVACHEEHECGSEGTKTIAIYFSPNQGGNEHADLTYAEKIAENELTLEQDNQGEVYQQTTVDNKPIDWMPWLIGIIGVMFIAGITFVFFRRGKKRTSWKRKK